MVTEWKSRRAATCSQQFHRSIPQEVQSSSLLNEVSSIRTDGQAATAMFGSVVSSRFESVMIFGSSAMSIGMYIAKYEKRCREITQSRRRNRSSEIVRAVQHDLVRCSN